MMTSKKLIDVIIVNWNSGEHLFNCISALIKFNASSLCNIIVIDNNSHDHSLELIQKFSSQINIIINNENIGFAAGCNYGASSGEAKYLLFLNPDVIVKDSSIEDTLNFYESKSQQENIGVVGIRLLNMDGSIGVSHSKFPRFPHFLAQVMGLHKIYSFFSPLRTGSKYIDATRVDQITGAFFFISRKNFEKFNGFDERFFVYYEELDLNLRLHRSGYVSYTLPNVIAMHYGGGCSEFNSAKSLSYNLKSRLKYFNKNYTRFEYTLVYALTVFVELPIRLLKSYIVKKKIVGIRELFVDISGLKR